MALVKMYLYLARRDKTSVKLLMSFMGQPMSGRVDIKMLGLSTDVRDAIEQEVFDKRMLWEPWVEPAESYQQLKDKLHKRGFSDLPMSSTPTIKYIKGQSADTRRLEPAKRTMLQKKS